MGTGFYYSNLRENGLGSGFGVEADLDGGDDEECDRDDEWLNIACCIESALSSIGSFGKAWSAKERRGVAFNNDMMLVGEGAYYQVGMQGWQHDYVVEVGGTKQIHEWLSDSEWHENAISGNLGMSEATFKKKMAEFHTRLARYLALCVMDDTGLRCHELNGGWGRAGIATPQQRRLDTEVHRLRLWLLRRSQSLTPERASRKAA